MRNKRTAMRATGTRIFLCLAAAASSAAYADLVSAQRAFQKGDYEQAFNDYRDLAQLGQPQAQYNLAIMYAKGLGVRQSELNAYAWASLAADNGDPNGKQLAETLRPDLAPGSEKIADETRSQYGRQALDQRLMPAIENDAIADALEKKRCRPRSLFNPGYPDEARRKGIQGEISVEYTVHPDGSARNPRIVYEVPREVFESAVRKSVLRSRFATAPPDSKPTHCTMYYRFVESQLSAGDYPKLKDFVQKTYVSAQAGDPNAELLYGMLLTGVPQLQKPRAAALPWFLRAAQSGSAVAQYQVGYSLLKGWGCHCEENKGSEWMRRAAQQDEPDAQVALAEYALREKPSEETVKQARMWLQRAAASGSRDGKLYLAALLAAAPYGDVRDASAARRLIDEVFAGVDDDPTAFEIRAAAAANSGDFGQAVNAEETAINRAGHLSWDLTPLRERLAHYQSHQPWYGDLLGF